MLDSSEENFHFLPKYLVEVQQMFVGLNCMAGGGGDEVGQWGWEVGRCRIEDGEGKGKAATERTRTSWITEKNPLWGCVKRH